MGDIPLSLEMCGNSELDYDYVVVYVGNNMGNCIDLLLFRCKLDVNQGMNMIHIYILNKLYCMEKMWKYLKLYV